MSQFWTLVLIGAALVSGCDVPSGTSTTTLQQPVVVAVLPDQAPARLSRKYEPLLEYLAAATGLKFELIIPRDYEDLLDAFLSRRAQLFWFGGLTFVQASARGGAMPLVMRDVDLDFTSHFLVRADAPGRTVQDFKGQRLTFGPRLSTSGHLMPRFFLQQVGIDPEATFVSVAHSRAHDDTAERVKNGMADLGVANSIIIDNMFADGRLSRADVRVLEKSPSYRDNVWAVQPDFDPVARGLLLDAFLALDRQNSEDARVLIVQSAGGYLPAHQADFDAVRAAARLAGLLAETDGP